MKPCTSCQALIHDDATKCKHCLSYQDSGFESKPNYDVASLVIRYIGVAAISFTLVSGLLGYLGFSTINDIVQRTDKIQHDTKDIIRHHKQTLVDLQNESKRTILMQNSLLVTQSNDRYQGLLNKIVIDELEKHPGVLYEIDNIAETLRKDRPLSKRDKIISERIVILTDALHSYQEEEYDIAIEMLNKVSNKALFKHRLLTCCYNKLHIYQKERDSQKASFYLKKAIEHCNSYEDLANYINIKTTIAKMNKAILLVKRNQTGDLDAAIYLFNAAIIEMPEKAEIYFNLAIVYDMNKEKKKAIASLEKAKERGFFRTEEAKERLKNAFREYFESKDKDVREAMQNLLKS